MGEYAASEFGGAYSDPTAIEPIGYSNFGCTGTESTLISCSRNYSSSCTSSRFIALECGYYLGSSIGARLSPATTRVACIGPEGVMSMGGVTLQTIRLKSFKGFSM